MKHCHFSILWNELPFLEQKLPFLYEYFSQLIFYDLKVGGKDFRFSTDGSHEFIKDYPDPENKITLIEQKDLSDIPDRPGVSYLGKRKMFVLGSRYVRDDMDVFWCTDMDEFFNPEAIRKTEKILQSKNGVKTINMRHHIFFKDQRFVYCEPNGNTKFHLHPRITRHRKGNVYGHCTLGGQYPPCFVIKDEMYYHFSVAGYDHVTNHKRKGFWEEIIEPFDDTVDDDKIHGHSNMHPDRTWNWKIRRYRGPLPKYINFEKMFARREEK